METFSKNHEIVCFGEVLWDILPSKTLPGGAPMNVAYHLKKLGNNPALITRVGIDDYGEKLVNLLSGSGLSVDNFQMDYSHPTGLVYAKTNDHNEVMYDIVHPSAWDFIQWHDGYEKLVEGAEYFVYGSLAARSNDARNTLYRLLDTDTTKVLDINLRPPHFNRSGIEYLLKKANILKVNIAELELITGWFGQLESIENRIEVIQEKFHIPKIIVTMGANGSVVNDKGHIYRHPGFKVKVVDTIGSGDSFLAGFLNQQLKSASAAQSLVFASALGALIATYPGACPNYDLSEIDALINNNFLTKVQTS